MKTRQIKKESTKAMARLATLFMDATTAEIKMAKIKRSKEWDSLPTRKIKRIKK